MEELGGGGHLSNAATQVEGHTVTEVKTMLLETIDATEDSE
jgi:c-di-AMP phosphodiesterase-like protein